MTYFAWLYLFIFTFLLMPASIGIALFRYHLWDIDLIIRRTLQYSILSVLPGQVFQNATGQQSLLVIVISTLAIASLFNPLRRRIQSWIDRRFFRQQYDAVQAVEAFALAARSHVELETLAKHLAETAREALQPEGVWVWMRKEARQDLHKNRGVQ